MRTKTKNNVKPNVIPGLDKGVCQHHWLIESATGPTSRGVCKICGTTKEFFNSAESLPDAAEAKRRIPFHELPELDVKSDGDLNNS